MKKNNLCSLLCLSLITVISSLSLSPKKVEAKDQTLSLCQGTRNTIRIYRRDGQMRMRVFNQRDQLVWLNTYSRKETVQNGINYFNNKGKQKVRLFVANNSTICLIAIEQRPVEKGFLLEQPMSNNRPSSSSNTVTGTLTYRQRIALPAGAVIEVKLLDVSLQDVPAKVISEQTITTKGEQVPIPFQLTFNPDQIKANNSYAVMAQIKLDNRLAFTTTRRYAVITNGEPLKVELVLEQVQSLEKQLLKGEWLLEDLAGAGVLDNLQTTLKFDASGRVTGSGGCNRYFASYQLEGNQFKLSQIGSTNKACSPAIMDQEFKYFKALQQADSIRLEGEFLFIDSPGLPKPLKFTRL